MTVARRLFHLARADFLERVRRYGFLITLLACVCAGYAFVPPQTSRYVTLRIEDYRGIYNSAWIGTTLALLTAAFLSLIGFFLVKNTIDRDRKSGVGQILAGTPVSKVQYTVGKALSNFSVLAAMTIVVAVAAFGMQLLRAEDTTIHPWALLSPFVLLTLPAMMVTAGLAVVFETIPGLRGGLGNVLYVFAWGGLLGNGFNNGFHGPHNDVIGVGVAWPSIIAACFRAYPTFDPAHPAMSMGINIREAGTWTLSTFRWDGIPWTLKMVGWRSMWMGVGLGIAAVAAIPFDRFDPAATFGRSSRRHRGRFRRESAASDLPPPVEAARRAPDVHLTPLDAAARRARPGAMIVAEWKLLTRGLRWWYLGPLAVAIMSIFMPVTTLRFPVLPLAWLWPVLLWSRLGTREIRYGTGPLFFSSPRPLTRQLPATWLAGVGVSVIAAGPIALRLMMAGETGALLGWVVGAVFAPALSLALGIWTGSSKFFEALYTLMWYALLQHAPGFDFMGATPEGVENGAPSFFAAASIVLLAFAFLGRRRQLQS
jgi:hypothetical protein